ncbi:purine-nucleoside phosphorylase [Aliidiomarina soli]|uniref:Uridine phosphorylase n=1 Tax=Aliidiomarina soli TaxID=1928574 RepID=A0A432WFE7_9GAMM|nr:purine-nucleoside phosphorylase [Aliidiomarina soli]RUO32513.1 purine-nucleoside phosphorylase [Aliidiomarina soli]
MSTPHIAAEPGAIATSLLMPGDPLRAKFIAEHFLCDVTPFNKIRNILGFTGTYKGRPVSVMGSGMGMPSLGIYAHELYTQYNVERIIRVGSCGAYTRALSLFDVLVANSAWTESTFARFYSGHDCKIAYPHHDLNMQLFSTARAMGVEDRLQLARVHSSDVFYRHDAEDYRDIYRDYGCVAVEMEAFALFHIAQTLQKQAACLLTVSDCLETGAAVTSKQREQAFTSMIELALETLVES